MRIVYEVSVEVTSTVEQAKEDILNLMYEDTVRNCNTLVFKLVKDA